MKHHYISLSIGMIRGSLVQYQDARFLYMVLVSLSAKQKSTIVKGVDRNKLRELTGYSKDRVSKCVRVLKEVGVISTKKVGGGKIEYSFPLGFAPTRAPKGIEITEKTFSFIDIDTDVILNKRVPPTARLLQVILLSFRAKKVSIGMESLEKFLSLSRRSICRYLFTLKRLNGIRVERRKYDNNRYTMDFRGFGNPKVVSFGKPTKNTYKNKTITNTLPRSKKCMYLKADDTPYQYHMDEVMDSFE